MRGDVGKGERNAHAKAEAGDEGKRAASPDGKHGDVKGPVFGADLCCHSREKKTNRQHRTMKNFEQADWDETFKDGAWTTGRHVPSVAVTEVQFEVKTE